MDKTIGPVAEAVAGIGNGAMVMTAGFGGSGAPIELIHALIDKGPKGLTINNTTGNDHVGIAAMAERGVVAKIVCSFPHLSKPVAFNTVDKAGTLKLEMAAGHLHRPRGRGRPPRAGRNPDPRRSGLPMSQPLDAITLSNAQIAWPATQDIEDGVYVNLGFGKARSRGPATDNLSPGHAAQQAATA